MNAGGFLHLSACHLLVLAFPGFGEKRHPGEHGAHLSQLPSSGTRRTRARGQGPVQGHKAGVWRSQNLGVRDSEANDRSQSLTALVCYLLPSVFRRLLKSRGS